MVQIKRRERMHGGPGVNMPGNHLNHDADVTPEKRLQPETACRYCGN
jgi:hypothetical protein